MSKIYQLAYFSQATEPMERKELHEMLMKARAKNKAAGISGILIYNGGCFLQLLEGDNAPVDKLYDVILEDKRHHAVSLIFRQFTENRIFKKDWYMLNRRLSEYSSDVQKDIVEFIELSENGGQTVESEQNFVQLLRAMAKEF